MDSHEKKKTGDEKMGVLRKCGGESGRRQEFAYLGACRGSLGGKKIRIGGGCMGNEKKGGLILIVGEKFWEMGNTT